MVFLILPTKKINNKIITIYPLQAANKLVKAVICGMLWYKNLAVINVKV